jgi:hypothetical protein
MYILKIINTDNGTFNSAIPHRPMIVPLDAKLVDINGDRKMEIIILDRFSDYEHFAILWIYCESH